MSRISFRDRDGRPLAGAVVAITAAPGETTDIGYVTDGDGAITVGAPAPGRYGFTLTHADGGRFDGSADLHPERDAEVTANPIG